MVALKVYFHIVTAVYVVGVVSIVWTAQTDIVIISLAKKKTFNNIERITIVVLVPALDLNSFSDTVVSKLFQS